MAIGRFPLVSIIIPCYNAEKYVAKAIDSCLSQNYPDIEIIVVNDGSTDNSSEIINNYVNNVIVINQINKGGAAARNIGLKVATGDYIKFLDADDYLETSIIEIQVTHFLDFGSNDSIAVYGDVRIVGENQEFIRVRSQNLKNTGKEELAELIDSVIITTTPLYRRTDLEKVNGFNESLKSGQEHELNIKLFLSGVRFIYYDEIVFNHRNYYSPHRISNRNWPETDPCFMWQLVDHYEQLIKSYKGIINGSVAIALASKLASAGRLLVRAGQKDLAEQHFERAVKICPDKTFRIGNRFWLTKYYMAAKLIFGLTATETLYWTLAKGLSQFKLRS